MTMTELDLTERMASFICHELVGSATALSHGVEFLKQQGGGAAKDVEALLAFSADQLNDRLRLARLAFGTGLTRASDGRGEVQAVLETLFAGGPAKLRWELDQPARADDGAPPSPQVLKAVLNLAIIGHGLLARGGVLTIGRTLVPGGLGLTVTAAGQRLLDGPAHLDWLVTPGQRGGEVRTAQVEFTRAVARASGHVLSMTRAPSQIIFTVSPPD